MKRTLIAALAATFLVATPALVNAEEAPAKPEKAAKKTAKKPAKKTDAPPAEDGKTAEKPEPEKKGW